VARCSEARWVAAIFTNIYIYIDYTHTAKFSGGWSLFYGQLYVLPGDFEKCLEEILYCVTHVPLLTKSTIREVFFVR